MAGKGRAYGPALFLFALQPREKPVEQPLPALSLGAPRADNRGAMSRPKLARPEGGFTIVEVMVAIFLLLAGVLGTTTLLNGANGATLVNEKRTAATNLTR